jgi:hypothetical protein
MNIEQPARWAHNWCYYFFALGFVALGLGFFAVLNAKKGQMAIAGMALVASLIQAATMMTLFWMCRSSLKPSAAPLQQFS